MIDELLLVFQSKSYSTQCRILFITIRSSFRCITCLGMDNGITTSDSCSVTKIPTSRVIFSISWTVSARRAVVWYLGNIFSFINIKYFNVYINITYTSYYFNFSDSQCQAGGSMKRKSSNMFKVGNSFATVTSKTLSCNAMEAIFIINCFNVNIIYFLEQKLYCFTSKTLPCNAKEANLANVSVTQLVNQLISAHQGNEYKLEDFLHSHISNVWSNNLVQHIKMKMKLDFPHIDCS